jgi:hypothetical protein
MPTVTVDRSVTVADTAAALQRQLGDRYEITTQGQGVEEALRVRRGVASLATVRLEQDGSTTIFRVHGGGLIISRLINELGIAKTVAGAIEESLKADQQRP